MLKIFGIKKDARPSHVFEYFRVGVEHLHSGEALNGLEKTAVIIHRTQNIESIAAPGHVIVVAMTRSGVNTAGPGIQGHVVAEHEAAGSSNSRQPSNSNTNSDTFSYAYGNSYGYGYGNTYGDTDCYTKLHAGLVRWCQPPEWRGALGWRLFPGQREVLRHRRTRLANWWHRVHSPVRV